ncbi:MAG: Fic family protein [Solirubrobacteraceae bacterium]
MPPVRGHFVTKHYDGIAGAQTAAQRRGGEYRAFVPDPIADLELSLPNQLAAELETASARVRELNSTAPKLASLEAVAHHLLRQESTASSRIEGLALGHRRIALADFDLEGSADQRAADIVGNIRAMSQAIHVGTTAERIKAQHVIDIHRTLFRFGDDEPIAGKWRDRQGWIGGSAPTRAAYVPPPADEVERLVIDLCRFINRTDVPVLVQAAIAHAQFENVHPFADGNGRVGRCLIHTVLRRRNLAPNFVPPISVVLGARRNAYFAGLAEFRSDGVEHWLSFFADATVLAARKAEELSTTIDELQERWLSELDRRPRRDSTVHRVVVMLPAHPVLNVPAVQRELGVSDVAAGASLNELQRAGVLVIARGRLRGRVWECPTMYALMDDFEASLT